MKTKNSKGKPKALHGVGSTDLLAELEAKLATAKFKRSVAAQFGWSENVEQWCNEERRLEEAITKENA